MHHLRGISLAPHAGLVRAVRGGMKRAWLLVLFCGCGSSVEMMQPPMDDLPGFAVDLSESRDLAVVPGSDLATTTIDLASADLTPEAPSVRLIGRIDYGDPDGPRFSWSGSAISARFSGTAVSVHLADSINHFKVLIDGQPQAGFVGSGNKTYPLASGLTNGVHELLIYRQSEAFDGATQFFELTFPGGGQLLAPPPAKSRRIELIGDSISNGYGNTGTPYQCGGGGSCTFSLDTEDHWQSYGAIAARNLDAELHSISWSGIGMVKNCCGAGGSTVDTMPKYYPYALTPPETATNWDFTRWTPDLVLINLGTNDYTAGDPGTTFTNTYVTFVEGVRQRYPNAHIMLLIGPMLAGADLTSIKGRIATVVSTVNDAKLSTFELTTQDLNAVGCDCHPSVAKHQSMAAALTAEIRSKLSW
jgi:lysophospholipase L1-like esterase